MLPGSESQLLEPKAAQPALCCSRLLSATPAAASLAAWPRGCWSPETAGPEHPPSATKGDSPIKGPERTKLSHSHHRAGSQNNAGSSLPAVSHTGPHSHRAPIPPPPPLLPPLQRTGAKVPLADLSQTWEVGCQQVVGSMLDALAGEGWLHWVTVGGGRGPGNGQVRAPLPTHSILSVSWLV